MKHSFRQNAPDIALFDCCMGVGESGFFDRRGITEPGVLLRMMDRFGIAEALVYDQQEVEIGRFGDNAFILDFCRASPRLHPSVALTPPGTGELPPPREWVASLLAQGIRAVRAWPEWHRYDFLPYCLGPLLEELQAQRMPLFVSYNGIGPGSFPWGHKPDLDHIQRTAEAYPDLPIILVHTGMLENRRLLPLLRACPNVRCDITCAAGGFPELVSAGLGSERLLFTGEFPIFDPGLIVTWPRYADVPEQAAQRIAGENLRDLLAGVKLGRAAARPGTPRPASGADAPPPDRVRAALLAGAPLDFLPVIDLHGHYGQCASACARPQYDPEMMVREMDLYGVDVVVCSAITVGGAGSLKRGNDQLLEAARAAPGRILGYCVLSSNSPERNLDELKRCYDLGLRCGVKMHRYHQPEYRITDAFLAPVMEFLNEKRLIYINHDLGADKDVIELARRYPELTIINGHGGAAHARIGLQHPNVYANSCSIMAVDGVERLVQACGPGHLTLGSDFSLFHLGWGVGPIAYAAIPESGKADILGGNAMRIFNRADWFRTDPPASLRRWVT
ncbi:MAG: amidohydrolase family protein [Lentisphaerae bacterium]|nr:amidohydrolase family protein [Lentisphaerota bacterium]